MGCKHMTVNRSLILTKSAKSTSDPRPLNSDPEGPPFHLEVRIAPHQEDTLTEDIGYLTGNASSSSKSS